MLEAQRGGLWKQLRKSAISGGTFFFQARLYTHTQWIVITPRTPAPVASRGYTDRTASNARRIWKEAVCVCVSQAITTARSTVVVLKREEEEEKKGEHTHVYRWLCVGPPNVHTIWIESGEEEDKKLIALNYPAIVPWPSAEFFLGSRHISYMLYNYLVLPLQQDIHFASILFSYIFVRSTELLLLCWRLFPSLSYISCCLAGQSPFVYGRYFLVV